MIEYEILTREISMALQNDPKWIMFLAVYLSSHWITQSLKLQLTKIAFKHILKQNIFGKHYATFSGRVSLSLPGAAVVNVWHRRNVYGKKEAFAKPSATSRIKVYSKLLTIA